MILNVAYHRFKECCFNYRFTKKSIQNGISNKTSIGESMTLTTSPLWILAVRGQDVINHKGVALKLHYILVLNDPKALILEFHQFFLEVEEDSITGLPGKIPLLIEPCKKNKNKEYK